MESLKQQFKKRRKELGLKQHDMLLRIGMSRQQYQNLESKGNPRLDTLELIAKGLNGELLFIPQEKLSQIKAVLEDHILNIPSIKAPSPDKDKPLSDDPWQDILEEDE